MNGTFIISLDFELLWGLSGWNQSQIESYRSHVEGSLAALKRILEVLVHFDMKCSIAFVGGMNYRSTDELNNVAPELHPQYTTSIFSSYESLIPNIDKLYPNNLFFCKDVITELSKNPKVELASHTFSHYYCLEKGQSSQEFEADICTAVNEAKNSGISFKTIIFPRNQVSIDYLNICSEYGLTHYRGNLETFLYRSEHTPKKFSLRRVLRLLDAYVNLSGHNTYMQPKKEGQMINVPGSRFLRPYSRSLAFLEPLKVKRILDSIEYAAKHSQIYHLWWHPHNFGLHIEENINQLEKICECYQAMHRQYGMECKFISENNSIRL